MTLSGSKAANENSFHIDSNVEHHEYQDQYQVNFVLLEDYNRMEKQEKELVNNEILIYSSGEDFNYPTVNFMGEEFPIKKEWIRLWAAESGAEDIQGFINSEIHILAVAPITLP